MIKQITKFLLVSMNMFLIKIFQIESFEKKKHEKKIKSYAHEQYDDSKFSFLNDVADGVQSEKLIKNEQIFVESTHRSNEKTFKS